MRSFIRTKTLVLAAALLAVAATAALPAPAHAERPLVWKFATLAPKNVGWARHIEQLVLPYIQEATHDNLRVKVYWGGVMGDDEDYLRKMRIGQLHGAGFSGQGVAFVVPEMVVLQLPFIFRNYGEVDYVKSQMTPTFDKLLQSRGLFLVAWVDQDFDQVYSLGRPPKTLEDFRGQRFMTWYGLVEEKLVEALGANAIPMDVPDIPSGARQGLYDIAMGPALWTVGAQMYAVYKYVNPMPVRYSPALIVVTMDAWNLLEDEYQKAFFEGRDVLMQKFCAGVRDDNRRSLQAMIDYGLREVEPGPEEMERLQTATRPIWDELAGDLYPKSLLVELEAHLKEYRANPALREQAAQGMLSQAHQAAPR